MNTIDWFELYEMIDLLKEHINDYEDLIEYYDEGGCSFIDAELEFELHNVLSNCENFLAMLDKLDE